MIDLFKKKTFKETKRKAEIENVEYTITTQWIYWRDKAAKWSVFVTYRVDSGKNIVLAKRERFGTEQEALENGVDAIECYIKQRTT